MSLIQKRVKGALNTTNILANGVANLRDPTDATRTAVFDLSAAANSTTTTLRFPSTTNRTITLPAGDVAIATTSGTQTLSNKTLTAPVISTINSITLPTGTVTVVGLDTQNTLSNKTLTDPVINGDSLGNTRFGSAVLSAISGTNNVALGFEAGNQLTTGSYNTLLGKDAGFSLTTGSENVLGGAEAGRSLTTQSQQIFIGRHAGREITSTTGSNMIIGAYPTTSVDTVTSIANSIYIGSDAGRFVSGSDNVAIGTSALGLTPGVTKTGSQNVAVGFNALGACDTASRNVCYGFSAGISITTGSDNVVIGSHENITMPSSCQNSTIITTRFPSSSSVASNTIAILNYFTGPAVIVPQNSVSFGRPSNTLPAIVENEFYVGLDDTTVNLRGNFILNTLSFGLSNVVLSAAKQLTLSGTSGAVSLAAESTGAAWTLTLPANAGSDGQYLYDGAWVPKTRPVRTISTFAVSASATVNDDFINLTNAVTLTLPAANTASGKMFTIFQVSGTSTVTIAGGHFIRDTSTTSIPILENQTLTVISTGVNLYILI